MKGSKFAKLSLQPSVCQVQRIKPCSYMGCSPRCHLPGPPRQGPAAQPRALHRLPAWASCPTGTGCETCHLHHPSRSLYVRCWQTLSISSLRPPLLNKACVACDVQASICPPARPLMVKSVQPDWPWCLQSVLGSQLSDRKPAGLAPGRPQRLYNVMDAERTFRGLGSVEGFEPLGVIISTDFVEPYRLEDLQVVLDVVELGLAGPDPLKEWALGPSIPSCSHACVVSICSSSAGLEFLRRGYSRRRARRLSPAAGGVFRIWGS